MATRGSCQVELNKADVEFYLSALRALGGSGVPFLVGGAFAFERYCGIPRHTKDFDVFVRPGDFERTLAALSDAGYLVERTFPHWLGKAYCGDAYVDVIFSGGNAVACVDDEWFRHAVPAEVLGISVRLCPAEEMIWSKAFIMERERYDGADVAHLLRHTAGTLDWARLVGRFGREWRVLLAHLVLFGFIYPRERELVPAAVMNELLARLQVEMNTAPPGDRICRGTLLSRAQYLTDLAEGYADARLRPGGKMTAEEIARWTAAIDVRDEGEG